ncbi:MAG: hypothetical protein ABI797_00125 [Chloroflexota bacterium]
MRVVTLAALAAALLACTSTPLPVPTATPQLQTLAPTASQTTATPSPSGEPVPTATASPGQPGESPEPPAVARPFPGLYVTPAIVMSGSGTYATIGSTLSCDATQQMLGAGDWSVLAAARMLPAEDSGEQAGGTRWMLLSRGADLALVSLKGIETCVGYVELLHRGPLRVTGALSVDTTATMIPVACVELADGRVSVIGLLDGDGGWIGTLDVTVAPTVGSQALSAADFTSALPTIANLGRPLFDVLAAGTEPGATGELAPGDGFNGQVTITGTDPLSGTITMNNLWDENLRSVGMEASFACHITAYRGPKPAPVSESQGIALHLTATLDISGDFGIQSMSEVDLVGVLQAVTSRRYEATISATGSGTYEEVDYSDPDFQRRCTGIWTGTQVIDVGGEVSVDSLRLTFTPAGPPSLTFSQPCNVDARSTELTLPFAYALSASVEVAWPPGTPGTDHQTIDLPIEGLGSDLWEVTFTSAP